MDSGTWPLLSGLLVGFIVGALAVQVATPPTTGTSVPSHGLTAATGCAKADDTRAWLGQVPEDDYRAVYLSNYTITHDATDPEFRGNLSRIGPGTWRFAVTSSPGDDDRDVPEDCQPRTILSASIAVPATAEELRITVEGERVTTVATTSNGTRFGYLGE